MQVKDILVIIACITQARITVVQAKYIKILGELFYSINQLLR